MVELRRKERREMSKRIIALIVAAMFVASSFVVMPVFADQPNYIIIYDSTDSLAGAVGALEAKYDTTHNVIKLDFSTFLDKSLAQHYWQTIVWEHVAGMLGWWQYYWYDHANDTRGSTYIDYCDLSIYSVDDFREALRPSLTSWITDEGGQPGDYVAVVGETGTSMEFYRDGLAANGILVPMVSSSDVSMGYADEVVDYSPYYDAYVHYTDVEFFAPWSEIFGAHEEWPEFAGKDAMVALAENYAYLMPCPEIPLIVDQALIWDFAVGRISGFDPTDTIELINRSPSISKDFVSTDVVPVVQYDNAIHNLVSTAGYNVDWNWLKSANYPGTMSTIQGLPSIWYTTCHGNVIYYQPQLWETGYIPKARIATVGDGVHTYWFKTPNENYDHETTKAYPVPIGAYGAGKGTSGKVWMFIDADPLKGVTTMDDEQNYTPWYSSKIDPAGYGLSEIPPLDGTFVWQESCLVGSSEWPLFVVSKGAVGVVTGIASQEVCEGGQLPGLFFSAVIAGYPMGKALMYAYQNLEPVEYFYSPPWLWPIDFGVYMASMYLLGDPAVALPVPHPSPAPLPLQVPGRAMGDSAGGVLRRGLLFLEDYNYQLIMP